MRHVAILILIACLPYSSSAQDGELGNWAMYFGKHQIGNRFSPWSLHSEIQYRSRSASLDNVEQILPRIGLNLQAMPHTMLTVGYAWIPSYPDPGEIGSPSIRENRIWQQVILTQRDGRGTGGRFKYEHRYRFEQRWINDDFRLRLRYRILATYGFGKTAYQPNTWFLAVYDEIFVNTERTFFDRNRFYTALGYKLNTQLSFQAGFLHQEVQATGGKWYLQFAVLLNGELFSKADE